MIFSGNCRGCCRGWLQGRAVTNDPLCGCIRVMRGVVVFGRDRCGCCRSRLQGRAIADDSLGCWIHVLAGIDICRSSFLRVTAGSRLQCGTI